jgi:hypothetical protein
LKQARPWFDFRYIHHEDDTADTRKLEKHVERDEKDRIVKKENRRKRKIMKSSRLILN